MAGEGTKLDYMLALKGFSLIFSFTNFRGMKRSVLLHGKPVLHRTLNNRSGRKLDSLRNRLTQIFITPEEPTSGTLVLTPVSWDLSLLAIQTSQDLI